ncbi:MAG: class IIb bacteriocin, lactobin A/cerein 7B family [Prolixibacteraceae bacterium]
MKDLELMGIQEMDAVEMRNVEGGSILAIAIAFVIGFVGGYLFGEQLEDRGV